MAGHRTRSAQFRSNAEHLQHSACSLQLPLQDYQTESGSREHSGGDDENQTITPSYVRCPSFHW
jgi:hypothetical protein